MVTGGGAVGPRASAERKADAARARSAYETSSAERHEILAAQAPSGVLRDLHLRIAALHRSTAACHATAARLQDDFVARLARWARDRRAPRPLFMAGVAAACGTGSAALTLVGATFDQLALAASDEPARAAQELGTTPLAPGLLDLGQALTDAAGWALERDRRLRESRALSDQLGQALTSRIVIEQAKGMLAARLAVSVDEAFHVLRRHARSHRRRLTDVATDVVRGRLDLGEAD